MKDTDHPVARPTSSWWGSDQAMPAIKPVYTPENVADLDYLKDLGFGGEPPFTRGIKADPSATWATRQYSGFGSVEDTNRRWKFLIEAGQRTFSCALDLPTQIGIDSDDELAEDEVGRVGVAIDTLRDMEILLDGLDPTDLYFHFGANANAPMILAMYIAVAANRGIEADKLLGGAQNDVLKEHLARGTWIYPAQPSVKLVGDVLEHCTTNHPRMVPINISSFHMREAGASGEEAMGYAFSNGRAYIEEVVRRGVDADRLGKGLAFFCAGGPEVLEEVCLYRAARKVWARLMEGYGARSDEARAFRFNAAYGGSYFTKEQPELNLVRGGFAALIGALAGCQWMLIPCLDEVYAIPTEETQRLAVRTQQVVREETGVGKVIDPLGGSYYVEARTREYEGAIEEVMREVRELGGMVKGIESGILARKIGEGAYRRQRALESGETVVVGVNKYRQQEEEGGRGLELHELEEESVRRQVERLKEVKRTRDSREIRQALGKVKEAARRGENVMPALIEAVQTYATLGEMVDSLKEVYGEFQQPASI